MKKRTERIRRKKVTPLFLLYDLPVGMFIEVVCHLDVFSLCCLFLTEKHSARPGYDKFFNQLILKWNTQFIPYQRLSHTNKRLFILATNSINIPTLKRNRFVFDEEKLNMRDSNGVFLIDEIRKANNPQLNEYIFTQLRRSKKHDKNALLILAVKLNSSNKWLSEQLDEKTIKNLPLCNGNQETLLYHAIKCHSIQTAKLLLTLGCDPNTTTIDYPTPLYLAVEERYLDMVRLLMEFQAIIDVSFQVEGNTPLFNAIQLGYLDIVQYLCSQGADVNGQGLAGSSALYIAMEKGHADIVACLLANGAEVNFRFRRGYSPLFVGARNGHLDVVKIMLAYYDKHHLLPNEASDDGSTPLYVAAQNGHHEICRILLRYGACVESVFDGGYTPLYVAVQNRHLEVVKVLAGYHPDYSKIMPNGYHPLYIATNNKFSEIVAFICSKKANPDMVCSSGKWPLYRAAYGDLHSVEALLIAGAIVDKHSDELPTALSIAAEKGQLDIIKLLIRYGADVNSALEDGLTPLHRVCGNDDLKIIPRIMIINLLIKFGANPLCLSKEGETPGQVTRNGDIREYMDQFNPINGNENTLSIHPNAFFAESKIRGFVTKENKSILPFEVHRSGTVNR